MSKGNVTIEIRDHVMLIGLDRVAKRNAFDLEMYRALAAAYGELHRNPDLRCGVLFAHGDHFTGGVDLKEWSPLFQQGRFPDLPEGAIDPLGLDENNRLRKPVVMAAQGICLTIGIELLLATDIRVAAANTRFAQIEIKRGIFPAGGATARLMQEIGWGNAMRYLLTGDEISATEALRFGLVQEVVETGKELTRAVEIAQTVAAQSPLGVQATLASARVARTQGEVAALRRLLADLVPLMSSEDVAEGLQSFIERRAAKFKGR
ncbi:MAG: crotonase/enoyl-CoA hydratase family protein [Verrucomicrobia bacterium]|nr:crotonase/enoyl-CoA hydratase family protein [Verrucomicrobiota bacterium]